MSSRRAVKIGKVSRVLVTRFSSLGDIVLTLPTVDSLKKALPESSIIYVTKKAYAPLLAGRPSIDRVLASAE